MIEVQAPVDETADNILNFLMASFTESERKPGVQANG